MNRLPRSIRIETAPFPLTVQIVQWWAERSATKRAL